MLSGLAKLPYKMLLESGDCTNPRFAPDFGKKFVSKQILIEGDSKKPEPLHFINRWLTWADPEMWEITPDQNANKYRPIIFPKSFMTKLFCYLTPNDLKNCRSVCKQWNVIINLSEFWTQEMVCVIDANKSTWMDEMSGGIGSICASYLESSRKRFSFWSQMRMRLISSRHLCPLLTYHACSFRRAVKNITVLELHECSFTWVDFLELLDHFRSLVTLSVQNCNFKNTQESMSEDFMISLGLKRYPKFEDILEQVDEKCPHEDFLFQSIKYLSILESDNQSQVMTPLLLNFLQERTKQMVEFQLTLGRSTAFMKGSNEQNQLWKSVHAFLASKNVKKVEIISPHNVSSGLVNRCFMFMNLWRFPPPGDEIWRLEQLTITLRPLALWSSFERHLIPLIQRLPKLRLLCIRSIVLRGSKTHFVKAVKEKSHPDCLLQIGLILDDQGGTAASTLEKEMLTCDLYQQHLISIEVIVHTDSTREIRDLVPYRKEVTFPTVQEFIVSTNASCRPRFFSFNVNMIVHNFPNLSELCIVDGPSFQYHSLFQSYAIESQWKDMSGAVFGDEDMQLILRSLTKLKKLVLRANMKYMTNTGFTGISPHYCRRLAARNIWNGLTNIPSLELMHRDGVAFDNLSNLEYLSIEGIGSNVTDIMAVYAFQGLESLRFIGLYGDHRISPKGKEYLNQMLFEKSHCQVFVT